MWNFPSRNQSPLCTNKFFLGINTIKWRRVQELLSIIFPVDLISDPLCLIHQWVITRWNDESCRLSHSHYTFPIQKNYIFVICLIFIRLLIVESIELNTGRYKRIQSSPTVNAGWMKSPTAVTDLGDISGQRFCCCCLDYAMDEEIRQFQFTNRLPCKCPRNLSKSCFTCGHQL